MSERSAPKIELQPKPEAPVVEQLLRHYEPVLRAARSVIERVITASDQPANAGHYTLPADLYNERILVQPPLSQYGLTAEWYMESLEEIGVSRPQDDERSVVLRNSQLGGKLAEQLIVHAVRSAEQPNVSLSDVDPTKALSKPTKDDVGTIARQAGLHDQGGAELTVQQQHLAMLLTMCMHHSESVNSVTDGWNGLVVERATFAKIVGKQRSSVKALEQSGHIRYVRLRTLESIRDVVLVNVDPTTARAYADEERGTMYLGKIKSRESREAVLSTVHEAYDKGWNTAEQRLPDGIRLITLAELQKILDKHDASLRAAIFSRFVYPAFLPPAHAAASQIPSELHFRNKQRSKVAAYFITKDRTQLDAWLSSPSYEQWVNNDQFMREQRIRWHGSLMSKPLEHAAYIPEGQGKNYLITDEDVAAVDAELPLSHGEYIMPAYQSRLADTQLHLYFTSERDGIKYNRGLRKRYGEQVQLIEARLQDIYAWRLQQLMSSSAWTQWEELPASSGLTENARLATLSDVRIALEELVPLSSTNLKKRGYAIDAQFSPASTVRGKLIICPEGPTQATRITSSAWYQSLMQTNRRDSKPRTKL